MLLNISDMMISTNDENIYNLLWFLRKKNRKNNGKNGLQYFKMEFWGWTWFFVQKNIIMVITLIVDDVIASFPKKYSTSLLEFFIKKLWLFESDVLEFQFCHGISFFFPFFCPYLLFLIWVLKINRKRRWSIREKY
jgi:hypothetical protein